MAPQELWTKAYQSAVLKTTKQIFSENNTWIYFDQKNFLLLNQFNLPRSYKTCEVFLYLTYANELRIIQSMNTTQHIINLLSLRGYKRTKVREAIISHLVYLKKPIDALALHCFLKKQKLVVNKSTVYREIQFLQKQEVIVEINFGDGKKRYEIAGLPHHHHIICTNCQKVEDVFIEKDLACVEKKISKEKSFLIQHHSLEFFGICRACL